jgi:DNA polymerase-1
VVSRLDELIRTPEGAYRALKDETRLGFDLETSGLDPYRGKIAVFSISGRESGKVAVVHTRGAIPAPLKALIENPKVTLVGHNVASFDGPWIGVHGINPLIPSWFDTMIAELAVLQTGRRNVRVNLAATTKRRLGTTLKKDIDHGSWMNESLDEQQLDYASDDVATIHALEDSQWERAREAGPTVSRAVQVEMDVIPAVIAMKVNGLPIDVDRLRDYMDRQRGVLREQEQNLYAALGRQINLGSHQQIKKAFADIGISMPSTAAEVLKEMHETEEPDVARVVGYLLEHRHAGQRIKMYTEAWVAKNVPDGRIHARFNQLGTDTGRFSSSDPNLQQIPKDDGREDGARGWFRAEPGHLYVAADYGQIEVRVMAALSRDAAMIALCETSHVHTAFACEIFGIEPDRIDDTIKRTSKAIVFTKLFGGGWRTAYKYARNQGARITPEQMKDVFYRFDTSFPTFAQVVRDAYYRAERSSQSGRIQLTLPTGLVRMLLGKDVRGPKILNTGVQGGAAAMLKYALIECHRRGLTEFLGATVHDELVAHVPERLAREFAQELQEAMLVGAARVIPTKVTVETSIGSYWGAKDGLERLGLAA